jgi:hypothetical protein
MAVVGAAAAAGLTACSNSAPPTATPASTPSVRVPVSCSQQYDAWNSGAGKGLITILGTLSSAETAGDTKVLAATLNSTKSEISRGTLHPWPACADPAGYWNVLLRHVSAAAANTKSASSMLAAMHDVPKIDRQLTTELKAL